MKGWAWVVVCVCVLTPCECVDYSCDGTPDLKSPPRLSDHFTIRISGNPETYSPLRKYQVSIEQTRQGVNQKMTGFALTVQSLRSGVASAADVGTFLLIDEALTTFSNTCPHMVTQTSNRLISELAVHWVAPQPNSGCITFRATVVEPGEQWTRHDGLLTRTICEDAESDVDVEAEVKECCACDEAKYEVTFEGLWSRHTHPKDFPPNGWLTKFSDVIGASHTADYRFWQYGEVASEGLKQVAERGWTRMLESELKSQSEHIRTIIKARGIAYPNVTGKTFAVFRVDRQHHLMSLVSMIVPSPDWIVGVSGLELCLSNCSWIESKVVNLNPWDVGTDSGVTYTSPDNPTDPPNPITQITSSNPDNELSPFYDPSGDKMKPLARLHITRQRLYEKSCTDETIGAEDEENADCNVSEWIPQPCSATCGRGIRYYQRSFLNPELAMMAKCNVQITKREPCQAQRWCTGQPQLPDDSRPNLEKDRRCDVTEWSAWSECSASCGAHGVMMRSRKYRQHGARKVCTDTHPLQQTAPCPDLPACEDHDPDQPHERCEPNWSDWTPCSVTCGAGVQTRTTAGHSYSSDGSKCSGVPRTEQVKCYGPYPTCDMSTLNMTDVCLTEVSRGDPGCKMGLERWYFSKDEVDCREFIYTGCKGNSNNFISKEKCLQACNVVIDGLNALYELGALGVIAKAFDEDVVVTTPENIDTTPTAEADRNRTRQMAKYGVRVSAVLAYHVPLANEFGTASPDCDPLQPESPGSTERFRGIPPLSLRNSANNSSADGKGEGGEAVNCRTTGWTTWSVCSVTCGRGVKARWRKVKVQPRAGGKPCPLLYMERKCRAPKCSSEVAASDSGEQRAEWGEAGSPRGGHCVVGAWSAWSACSATCGVDAFQMRTRPVLQYASTGHCHLETFQSRFCHLLPCTSE